MALTVDNAVKTVFGNKRVRVHDVDFDSSYPTGGESLTASDLGLNKVEFLIAESKSGYTFEYDYTNSKLLAYYVDNNAAADSAQIQVPNTTDLSSVTNVRVFAFGY